MRFANIVTPMMGAVMLFSSAELFAEPAAEPAVEPRAMAELKKMVSYFEVAEGLTFTAMSTTEDVSSTLQKLQADSSLEGVIQRPNKAYLKKSGSEQMTLWFDGQIATILDRKANRYAIIPVNGDLAALVEKLDDLGIETPFAGLLDRSLLQHVEKHVFKGDFYGATEINGLATNHLAFRQDSVDWQLWTDAATGAPRKVVITSKMLAAAPEHMILFKEVKAAPKDISPSTFQANIPGDATEVPIQSDSSDSLRNSSW